jgi:hypothetical protein
MSVLCQFYVSSMAALGQFYVSSMAALGQFYVSSMSVVMPQASPPSVHTPGTRILSRRSGGSKLTTAVCGSVTLI